MAAALVFPVLELAPVAVLKKRQPELWQSVSVDVLGATTDNCLDGVDVAATGAFPMTGHLLVPEQVTAEKANCERKNRVIPSGKSPLEERECID